MTPAEFEAVLEAADYPKVQESFEKIAAELSDARAELERVKKREAGMSNALNMLVRRHQRLLAELNGEPTPVFKDGIPTALETLHAVAEAISADAGSAYIHKDKAKSQLEAMAAVVKSAYVHKDQIKPLIEALTRINEISVIDEDMGCAVNWAGDALIHAKSIGL